ncbi:MAG: nitrate/nitrite two-component system sensor histidine kinase NarQ [Vibrio sp.]
MTVYSNLELSSLPKKPIATTIAKGLTSILILALATIFVAIFTITYSLKDAEAINVAGSLRMQSYRLAYDIQSHSTEINTHIELFEQSLTSPAMQSLSAFVVPERIQFQYQDIVTRWKTLSSDVISGNTENYLEQVQGLVAQIDHFVYDLQRFSENKLRMFAMAGGICLFMIFVITILIVRFARNRIVKPLEEFIAASESIQNKNFDIYLSLNSDTELDVLGHSYQSMAKQLADLYQGLELAVNRKTQELQQANDSLKILYESSEALSTSRLSIHDFESILEQVSQIEGVQICRLSIDEKEGGQIELVAGEAQRGLAWHSVALEEGDMLLGQLEWQQSDVEFERQFMESLGHIMSRALAFNHNLKQTEQLILMQERATIARELHDSLAQSLSYLKIQVALLKRNVNNQMCQQRCSKATEIIKELDEGLVQAYTQLRELLSTFRLKIEEANFGEALKQLLQPLQSQTTAQLKVNNRLMSLDLDAQQQVHLLQFIREAVLNAVKHSQAENISVNCYQEDEVIHVCIEDDGVGFDVNKPKLHHYGITIMQERASRLGGQCSIDSTLGQGSQIHFRLASE